MPTGRVKLNPRGPHFYVANAPGLAIPPDVQDVVNDATIHALRDRFGELNNVEWICHVRAHTPMATATWDDETFTPSKTLSVEVDEKDERWYSAEAFDYPWN